MRSTLSDIAREAGVSSATVDRVLNNRDGVRQRTRDLVLDAAQRLGYIAETGTFHSANQTALRLDFVLPAGTNTFMANLKQHIEEQASMRRDLEVRVHSIEGFNPESLAKSLESLKGATNGVGVIALDHPMVREAIRALASDDVKVATLVSDILHVPNVGYVGIDNRAAGRLAGYLLGRFLGTNSPNKVALFAGSLSYRGHEEREMGFRHVIAEDFPNLEIVELREMKDDRERAFEEATSLLRDYPDLAGIYNIGAGNLGIGRALKDHGRQQSVVFICHELTEHSKKLLIDGTIDAAIDQNPRVEAREALNMLACAVRNEPCDLHLPRLQVIFKENIPET